MIPAPVGSSDSSAAHGSPVWPPVTGSPAATVWRGAQARSASSTSSGALRPASQELAQTVSVALGVLMI